MRPFSNLSTWPISMPIWHHPDINNHSWANHEPDILGGDNLVAAGLDASPYFDLALNEGQLPGPLDGLFRTEEPNLLTFDNEILMHIQPSLLLSPSDTPSGVSLPEQGGDPYITGGTYADNGFIYYAQAEQEPTSSSPVQQLYKNLTTAILRHSPTLEVAQLPPRPSFIQHLPLPESPSPVLREESLAPASPPNINTQDHQQSEKRVSCPKCPVTFTRKHDLERHRIAIHEPEKHLCPLCKAQLGRKDSFTRHITWKGRHSGYTFNERKREMVLAHDPKTNQTVFVEVVHYEAIDLKSGERVLRKETGEIKLRHQNKEGCTNSDTPARRNTGRAPKPRRPRPRRTAEPYIRS